MKTAAVIKKGFLRLWPVQIAVLMTGAVNIMIDSLVTARFIGTEGMAAIALFEPAARIIVLYFVLLRGMQILCGNYIGSGEGDKVVSLFTSGIVLLGLTGGFLSGFCFVFRTPLAHLLGARGETAVILSDYISSYAVGITGQVLSSAFLLFLPFNNDSIRPGLGTGVMILSNLVMDIVCVSVFHAGMFGIGAATSISSLLSAGIMLTGFLKPDKTVYFDFRRLNLWFVPRAVRLGISELTYSLSNTVKTYMLNLTLMMLAGDAAVAAMNVQGSLLGVITSFTFATGGVFLVLGSIYYGEEDRSSFIGAARYSMRIGVGVAVVLTLIMMAGSSLIPYVFFSRQDPAWEITRMMLLLLPNYLIWNTIFGLFLDYYHCQGRIVIVNVLSSLEQILTGVFAMAGARLLGENGIWIAFPAANLFCLSLLAAHVRHCRGTVRPDLENWLLLEDHFGASADEVMEYEVHNLDEVLAVSSQMIPFCMEHGIDERRSRFAALAVEEMAVNVLEHGFRPKEKHSIDIRVVCKDGLILRVRDDCRAFDPKKRIEQFDPEDTMKNIGLRLVANMSEEITYRNDAGINTVLIKL